MKTEQIVIQKPTDFNSAKLQPLNKNNPQIIFAFADCNFFEDSGFAKKLKAEFPKAHVIGCSTAGEIVNDGISSGSLVLTAATFKNPNIKLASETSKGIEESEAMGHRLATALAAPDLTAVFILAQGTNINGSAMIQGIQKKVGNKVIITGGLAGDNGRFTKTFVMLDETVMNEGCAAIGFYGDSVKVSFGSVGGWQAFGPSRKVTKVIGNILYEIDGVSALTVYKNYLGEFAKDLPGSALHFPLSVLEHGEDKSDLIRTILGIDEKTGSLILAGDVPQD